MKKYLLVIYLLFTLHVIMAQEYENKNWRMEIGGGCGFAHLYGDTHGGPLLYLEPKYQVSDQIALGLRLDGALVVAFVYDGPSFLYFSRALFTSDFYNEIGNKKTIFFTGVGLGPGIDMNNQTIFNLICRGGIERSRLRIELSGGLFVFENRSCLYMGITFGYIIGGKKK